MLFNGGMFACCLSFFFPCGPALDPLWVGISGLVALGGLQFSKGRKRRPRAHQRKLIKDPNVASKLALFLSSPSVRSTMRAILFSRSREEIWRWLVATPPGSSLEVVLGEFRQRTPIALELVYMGWIALLAQYLAEEGATIMYGGQTIRLDLYSVILASTGSMKSWALNRMLSALRSEWSPHQILDPGSTAGLLAQLKESDGQAALWRIEEFGEFWKELTKESHAGTKRLLLLNYDGESVGKGLKAEKVIVERPYLSFLGTTVTENLAGQIPPEDWRSGMCQRIGFVLAGTDNDPERDWRLPKFALLKVDEKKIRREFQKMKKTPVHPAYEFSPAAISQIQHCWAMIGGMGDQEFVRRVEFRAFKYAVVFHWMLGKGSKFLDAEDIGWAFRLAMLHLADLRVILDVTEYSDFEDLLRRGEQFRLKCVREGKEFRPRELQMRLSRRLRSSEEAKSLFILVCERAARRGLDGVPTEEEIFKLTGVAPDHGGPMTRVPAVDLKETRKEKKYEKRP